MPYFRCRESSLYKPPEKSLSLNNGRITSTNLSPFTLEARARIEARRIKRGRAWWESGRKRKIIEQVKARVAAALSKPEPLKPVVFIPRQEVPRDPEPDAIVELPALSRVKEDWTADRGTVQFYVHRKDLIARSLKLANRADKPEKVGSAWAHPNFKPRTDGLPQWWCVLEWDCGMIPGLRKDGRRGARARF